MDSLLFVGHRAGVNRSELQIHDKLLIEGKRLGHDDVYGKGELVFL